MSILQIGTRGTYQDRKFELSGRARYAFDGGQWTEWRAELANGRILWLAEAQGDLMVSTEVEVPAEIALRGEIEVDETITYQGKTYTATDVKSARCVEIEGKVPEVTTDSSEVVVVDLSDSNGGFASLLFSPDDRARLFVGSYVEASALDLRNTRKLDGW